MNRSEHDRCGRSRPCWVNKLDSFFTRCMILGGIKHDCGALVSRDGVDRQLVKPDISTNRLQARVRRAAPGPVDSVRSAAR